MKTSPESLAGRATLPVNEIPAGIKIPCRAQVPEWEQIPVEKREELIQILAGMLVRQVQSQAGSHEQPS